MDVTTTLFQATRHWLSALVLTLLVASGAWAQSISVTGTVTDDKNEPLIGASIQVKGTQKGAITDMDGKFTIQGVSKNATLIVSYVGYAAHTEALNGRNTLVVRLKSEANDLDAFTVSAGYGTGRKVGSVVSSVVAVRAKDLEARPSPNPLESLQGKVAGLQLFTSSGEPSAVASLRLRGTGSLGASATPLFVLDGAPVEASTIRGLNANDMESVQILKDAAATSIYGARAANGVVYITTKSGRPAETAKVTIRGQYGWSSLANTEYFDSMMSADELLAFQVATGYRTQTAADALRQKYPSNTKWSEYMYASNMPSYQTDIAVSGGAGRTRYYLSAARQFQEGLRTNSDYGKNAFRLNLNTEVNKYISIGTNNMFSSDKFQVNPYGSTTLMMGLMTLIPPYYSPYAEDGTELDLVPGLNNYTPQYMEKKVSNYQRYHTLNSSSFIQIKPIKDLTLRSQFSHEHKTYSYDYLRLPSHAQNLNNGRLIREHGLYKSSTWTNTAEYKFSIAQKHNFIVLGGHEFVDYKYDGFDLKGEGLTHDLLTTASHITKEKELVGYNQEYAFLSYFGRLSYDYADKYFADFTYRNDASSRLAKGNRSSGFWSLGLMWKAKEESFLKDVNWLDKLSVKYSIGTQGNAAIGNYAAYALAGNAGQANTVRGRGISTAGNPDLGWENQFSTSISLETRLFNKLGINLELYHRLTSNMLMEVPFSYHTGFSDYINQNVGKYQNQGLDLSVNYDIFKDRKGNGVSVYANLNYNIDKVKELFHGLDQWTIPNTAVTYLVGEPVKYFYPIWAGVNPANGDAQWYVPGKQTGVKTTEAVTTTFSESLEQNTGINRYAPWNGGYGLNATYKGFNLDVDFTFSLGKYLISNEAFFMENPSRFAGYNQRNTVTDYWKAPGDQTRFPRYGVQFTQFDSRMIQNASFTRLKSLTLGYTLPESLLKKQKVLQGAKFYITGRNLLTFTGFEGVDPEVDSNLTLGANPNTKQVVVGVELNF